MRSTKLKLPLLAAMLVPLLAACDPREPVSVATDPRIVRGAWTGTVPFDPAQPTPITLNLTATYADASHYRLGGVMTLGQTSETVTGSVDGGNLYRYEQGTLQTAAVPPLMSFQSTDSAATWIVACRLNSQLLDCGYAKDRNSSQPPTPFTLTRGTP